MDSNQIIFLDNAKVHRTENILNLLNREFKYIFNSPYCNENAPVELAFNIIKGHLKSNFIEKFDLIETLGEIINDLSSEVLNSIYECCQEFWKK